MIKPCFFQVLPPSVVARITPSPTAQPCRASAKATFSRPPSAACHCLFQVAPPSVVAKTTPMLAPAPPTAQASWGLAHARLESSMPVCDVPVSCLFQVAPSSVVASMTLGSDGGRAPLAGCAEPSTQPHRALAKATFEGEHHVVADSCSFQVTPPLVVARMAPPVMLKPPAW